MRESTVAEGPFPWPDFMHWSLSLISGTRAFFRIPELRRSTGKFQNTTCSFKLLFINILQAHRCNEKVQNIAPSGYSSMETKKKKKRRWHIMQSYYNNRLKGYKQGTN